MRMYSILLIFILIFLSMSGCKRQQTSPLTQTSEPKSIEIENEFRSDYGGVREKKEVVITDAETWQSVWQDLNSVREPMPELPQVDFSSQMILAVFMGEQRSGGYGINIDNIYKKDDDLFVKIVEKKPDPKGGVTLALTHPYHIVVIPKIKYTKVNFLR